VVSFAAPERIAAADTGGKAGWSIFQEIQHLDEFDGGPGTMKVGTMSAL
jgi:hypothetical protein